MGCLRRIFRYKVFVDALFHAEVMSIFNLPIDKWYFTLFPEYLLHDSKNLSIEFHVMKLCRKCNNVHVPVINIMK